MYLWGECELLDCFWSLCLPGKIDPRINFLFPVSHTVTGLAQNVWSSGNTFSTDGLHLRLRRPGNHRIFLHPLASSSWVWYVWYIIYIYKKSEAHIVFSSARIHFYSIKQRQAVSRAARWPECVLANNVFVHVSSRMWKNWIKHQKRGRASFSIISLKLSDWKQQQQVLVSPSLGVNECCYSLAPSLFMILGAALPHQSCAHLVKMKVSERVSWSIRWVQTHDSWPSL